MKTKKLCSLIATVPLLVAALQVGSNPSWARTPSDASPRGVAAALQPFFDDHVIAGAVTLVASKEKILRLEAVGYADLAAGRPMRTDCLFWIASQSKPITATALMMLVDEGKVNVDDPVEKYLPEFKGQMVVAEQDPQHVLLKKPKHPILVRNVLSHTSGLPFKSAIEEPTLDQLPLAVRVQSYALLPLLFEPDTKSSYSNAGLNTAGRIVEVVSGMRYEEFLDRRLFKPLGMKDTTFWPNAEQLRRLAKSYKPSASKKGLDEIPIGQLHYPLDDRTRQPMPAGGLFSTATDLSLFYRMLAGGGVFAGKRYLSERAVKQMTSKQTGDLPTPYGFGFATGGGRIGHGGAYNTNSCFDVEHQLIMIFLVQQAGWRNASEKKAVLPAFQQAALKAFAAAPPPEKAKPAASTACTARRGLCCVGDKPFPVPPGTKAILIPGGDFESRGRAAPGWDIQGGQILTAADAPQGKAYCRIKAGKGGVLRTPRDVAAQPGRPYFLSMWLKSPVQQFAAVTFTSDERLRSFGADDTMVPNTGNQWRCVGYYFWMPVPCKTIQFHISPREDAPEGQSISVDDMQLRTATEAEMSAAYDAERAQLPLCDLAPRPGDGRNLALSVAKWEGRAGIPGKPFVIWAVGSSWTAAQRDGYGLIQAIRKRFPHAPEIQYKRHDGAGTPWDYVHGWIQQFVVPDQPDLIFTYTPGTLEGLDAMLREIRRHTTADVIVPSIHFIRRSTMTPDDVENGFVVWASAREICRKHGAEFVENRREMADYLRRNGLPPAALLCDEGHQSLAGCIRIWDNVGRHVAKPDRFSCAPESRERRVAVDPPARTASEQVSLSGDWIADNGAITAAAAGARLKVRFTGNRIDLLGRKMPGGGTVAVVIDGVPAQEAPVFYTTYIEPKLKGWPRGQSGQPGDNAPHAVTLGKNVVPQTWTITMTSDAGDYRLVGSATGPDGAGNAGRPFLSNSGQIGIDPKLWRNGRVQKDGRPVWYGNRTGDSFTFDVYRCARGELSFRGERPGPLAEVMVENLPNHQHTLELVTTGSGVVAIEGLYVYEPPEKD